MLVDRWLVLAGSLATVLNAGCIEAEQAAPAAGNAALRWEPVADGITYALDTISWPGQRIHVVHVDLDSTRLRVLLSAEAQRGRPVVDYHRWSGATVSINASFFDGNYAPVGLTVSERARWGGGYNRSTSPFLACTLTNQCTIYHQGRDQPSEHWHTVVSGVHSLVQDGRALAPTCGTVCSGQHPRTALGLSGDHRQLFLVVVEGRQVTAQGLTLGQLASYLRDTIGVAEAINLDGGGSSTLHVGQHRMSRLPDGQTDERAVANALSVISW
jgi:uncharacterized protein YigE (DUF2233 family)